MSKTDIEWAIPDGLWATPECFRSLFTCVKRQGADELLKYIETQTDFYTAPCSTRYHLCVPGGLLRHSLRVFENFNMLCGMFYPDFSAESIFICSALHDICKTNSYKSCHKSRKTGNTLPNGKPEWEDYTGYDFDEAFPYGHGEKSVYLINKFITLTDAEAMAIRWHMGFSDASFKGGSQAISNAMEKYPVIALLHSADLIATAMGE